MLEKPNQENLLRKKAEEQLEAGPQTEKTMSRPASEILHELQVHQIELEMQNENLCKTQAALEESRDRYLDLYEFAPVGYLTLNRDGLISECNLTASKLLGTTRNKLLQRRFDHIVSLDDRDRWRQLFINAMMHGERRDIELVIHNYDDAPLHVHMDCMRMQPGPPPPTLRVAFTAIPEREIITKQLLDMHKLLDQVQHLSKIGGWKYDCVTQQVTWTDEVYRIYGVGKDYDPGKSKCGAEFYLPEDRQQICTAIERAINFHEPYDLELQLVRLNGERVCVRTLGEPVIENGKVVAVTGTVMDITDRKKVQMQHEQMLLQMQQVHKMEALGQLTGGIAHDFNNILAAILGFTELTIDCFGDQMPATALEYLMQVQESGERAKDLIASMLAFARSGEIDALPTPPAPLIKEVSRMLAATLPSSISFVIRTEENVPNILINPAELHQVITNLCINARDAISDEGRIEIQLRVARNVAGDCLLTHQAFAGDYVELMVKDNGSGMSPEILRRVFDPFFTTKGVGKGTGMGLSVVAGIMKRVGGHVVADSSPEQGSCFRLYFPISIPNSQINDKLPASNLTNEVVNQSGRHVGIMVVDDEPALGGYLAEMLALHGYTPYVYVDSQTALDAFRARPTDFDVLLTDQTMPGLTGLVLIREMRAIRPELPVILQSGFSEQVDAQSASQLGVPYFLNKPVKPGELLAVLREITALLNDRDLAR